MLDKKGNIRRNDVEFVCLENIVPEKHLLRDIDKALDFSFIYDLVKDLYCDDNGRPSIDPVVLIKMQLIQYLFGIPSMRQTAKEIEVNMAYRWFIGYGITDKTPHFSVISKNYYRRFKDTDVFERIFEKILLEAVECGFVNTESIYIDGTHVKANANKKKSIDIYVHRQARFYDEQLRKEIEEDREEHNKKPLKDDNETDIVKVQKSTTDPECGMFHKGEKERCFAYSANTACDGNGFVLDTEVTAGNENDSSSFERIYDKVNNKFMNIYNVVADSGYRTPAICKKVIDDGKTILVPYKRPMTKKEYFKKNEYVYDEYNDCYICPQEHILHYSTTNKEGYREYRSKKGDCQNCPVKHMCTASSVKIVTRHLWEEYIEIAEDMRHTEGNKEIYAKRKETIERIFADAKEKHGMRYTRLKGLIRVTIEIKLKFACMNLKKLAKWKRKNGYFGPYIAVFLYSRKKITEFMTKFLKRRPELLFS